MTEPAPVELTMVTPWVYRATVRGYRVIVSLDDITGRYSAAVEHWHDYAEVTSTGALDTMQEVLARYPRRRLDAARRRIERRAGRPLLRAVRT